MGTWGTGVYDSDHALDFMCDVCDEVFNLALDGGLNDYMLIYADFVKQGFTAPNPFKSICISSAIRKELKMLDCWNEDSREPRRKLLLDLLDKSTKAYFVIDRNVIIYPYEWGSCNDVKVKVYRKDGTITDEAMKMFMGTMYKTTSEDIVEPLSFDLNGIKEECLPYVFGILNDEEVEAIDIDKNSKSISFEPEMKGLLETLVED